MSRLASGLFNTTSFRRGMMLDFSDSAAPRDAVRLADNMLPGTDDALSRRAGRQRRNDTTLGQRAVAVFRWLASDGVRRDLAAYHDSGTMTYGWVDGTGAPNNTVTGLTVGQPVRGMAVKYRQFLCNGFDTARAYVFSGGAVNTRAVGLAAPGTPAAAVNATAGNLNGSYTYKFTALWSDDGESNPSTASGAVAPVNQQADVSWSAPSVAGLTVSGYKIYRSKSAGVYRLVAQVGVVTAYTDNITDAAVAAAPLMQDNHNAPPAGLSGMLWWDFEDRAVAWGERGTAGGVVRPQRLWLGDVGKPEVWRTADDSQDALNTASFIDVPQTDQSNPILACAVTDNHCYVFNRRGVRLVVADGAGGYSVVSVANSEHHGILGPTALTTTDEGEIYYVSTNGLRVIRGRVDLSVATGGSGGSTELVSRSASRVANPLCGCVFRGVPAALRQYVAAAEFNDQVHIALGTDALDGVPPAENNTVMVFDHRRGRFFASSGRNVYGWAVVNEPGTALTLASAGWSHDASDPAVTHGNLWSEYVPGASVDQDAKGNPAAINWTVEDFQRPAPGLRTAALVESVVNIAADTGNITVQAVLDGGRSSSAKTVTFTAVGIRAWQDVAYWQSDPATDTPDPASRSSRVAAFAAVTDGSFRVVVDGVNKDTASINLTGAATIDAVVTTINAAVAAAGHGALFDVVYLYTPGSFRLRHKSTGTTHSVKTVGSAGVGTNLATAALLGTGAGVVERVPAATPASFEPMFWGNAASTATSRKWSSASGGRGRPRRVTYNGVRGQTVGLKISGGNSATLFGFNTSFKALPASAHGVI